MNDTSYLSHQMYHFWNRSTQNIIRQSNWWISNEYDAYGANMLKGMCQWKANMFFLGCASGFGTHPQQSSNNTHLFVSVLLADVWLIWSARRIMGWYFDLFKVNLIWPSSAFTTPLSSEINYLSELSTYDCFSGVGTASNKTSLVKKPREEDCHEPERKEGI